MQEKFIQLRRLCDEMTKEPLTERRLIKYLEIVKLSREIESSVKRNYILKEGA